MTIFEKPKTYLETGTSLLIILAIALYSLAAAHALALYFSWYWLYPWFDMVTHFWGGVCVGIGVLWGIEYSRAKHLSTLSSTSLLLTILCIGVVGVAWEIYEWVVQVFLHLPLPPNYWPDTLLDVTMDIVGAVLSVGIGLVVLKKRVVEG